MDDLNRQLPNVLLMGLKKSGKTSIQKVVFERLMPYDTATLATTTVTEEHKIDKNKFVRFQVYDCPGQTDPISSDPTKNLLRTCGAIVFVVDSTERVEEPLDRLVKTISVAQQLNPEAHIEVFVHKTDLLNDNQQHELTRRLTRAVKESLTGPSTQVSYYRTSIYDHSVFNAFSLVVQRLVRKQQGYINSLLQLLSSSCHLHVVYLFLSKTKIFVAVDQPTRDMGDVYEICSDALHMMTRLDEVYSKKKEVEGEGGAHHHHHHHAGTPLEPKTPKLNQDASIIHLSDKNVVYVREIPNDLTVVMVLPESQLENRALIDHNLTVFSSSATDIFNAGQQYLHRPKIVSK